MHRWLRLLAFVATCTGLCALPSARGDDDLQTALQQPLLTPGQVLADVRRFIEPRIVAPPKFANRAQWEQAAAALRRDMLEQIVFRGRARQWRDARCGVEWLDTIDGGPGYRIRKFRYEALPGMWIPALAYLPDKLDGKVPISIHVNGHDPDGKAAPYKQLRSINLAKRGMLVLNLEWFGMGQLRTAGFAHGRMNQLDLCGASGLAPFYLALSRAIDVAESLEHADKARIAVSGLSGGGWQTILISALDERVALANPVAGYGGFRSNILFDDMGDSEQAPNDMAQLIDYTHLTALRAPRPTLLTYNAGDQCCFRPSHTLDPLLQAAEPIFALYGAEDRLRSHVNRVPGTHNFEQENREQFYAMIGDFFYPGDKAFVRTEIASEPELKTAEQLQVPLPADNLDFNGLALRLAKDLTYAPFEANREWIDRWQRQERDRVRTLLRVPTYQLAPSGATSREVGAYSVTARIFKCGDDWSVPAVEIARMAAEPDRTAVLVADGGRASQRAEVERLLRAGYRVVAADPLLWGESKVAAQDPEYTYALFLAAVGERPLGIQAAQIAAVARWAHSTWSKQPVTLVVSGQRASMAALVATALEPDTIDSAQLSDSLGSFRQLIDNNSAVEEFPELFPFGLLAEVDVPLLVAMAVPRKVEFRNPSEQVIRTMAPIHELYTQFGVEFQPAK